MSESQAFRSSRGLTVHVVRVHIVLPGKELAQLTPGLFDGVAFALGAQLGELLAAVVLVANKALSECTGLNVSKYSLHVLLDVRGDHAGAGDVVAVLSGVRYGPALLRDATFVHEVHDELELVKHLEVGDLGLVAGLGENLEAVLNQLACATAQHGLLAEQVGLGLFRKRGLDDARTGATNGLGVRLSNLPGLARCV